MNGTVVWVTDGSYHKDVVLPGSGVGCLIFCTQRGLKLFDSFAEWSPNAGTYRVKLLGLLALHTFLSALKTFYKLVGALGKICHNNQGLLSKSKYYRGQIPVRTLQADINLSLAKTLDDTEESGGPLRKIY